MIRGLAFLANGMSVGFFLCSPLPWEYKLCGFIFSYSLVVITTSRGAK